MKTLVSWDDALALLDQAERLHRQFFHVDASAGQCWEPPVDVVESEDTVVVHVALPGVPEDAIAITHDEESLTVSGVRRCPAAPQVVLIHRIEIPYGRFERRILLPQTRPTLALAARHLADGCLVLTFSKAKEQP